ncbi:MAG: plasmid mobilization relaxosome protein MobC [Phormidesmis sp. RL_2_1]|nr:plasmid mobilization relaxosome protein MobC [Phormidesmis sp. RL_2_1]
MSSQTSKLELRDRIVTVRFTAAEYQQVVNEATAGQQQPAVYCRQRLLARDHNRPTLLSPTMLSEVRSLRMTLGHLGNALNQIAHQLNQGDAASVELMQETCELLRMVRTEVRDFHAILK